MNIKDVYLFGMLIGVFVDLDFCERDRFWGYVIMKCYEFVKGCF